MRSVVKPKNESSGNAKKNEDIRIRKRKAQRHSIAMNVLDQVIFKLSVKRFKFQMKVNECDNK